MLKSVSISNFQSHKHTVLEFIPGTNVIIGGTDTGKSALFRAINWVCSNRPLGDAYRSEWGGDTRVILHTSEGHIIERFRSDTKNEYIINGKVLAAFGSEVPQEVEQILGMDFANIQTQMDPPFLLSATPGEAARMLNKAASIDDIDYALFGLKKTHGKLSSSIKYSEEHLAECNAQMGQYDDIPILEKAVQKAEQLVSSLSKKSTTIATLNRLTTRASEMEKELESTEHILKLAKRHAEVELFYSSYRGRLGQYQRHSAVMTRGKELQAELSSNEYVDRAMIGINKSEKMLSRWSAQWKQTEGLKQLVIKGLAQSEHINRMQQTIEELEQEFSKSAPEYCPLCGNRWEKSK